MAILGSRNNTTENKTVVEPHKLITPTQVKQVQQSLIEEHADLVIRGMLDNDVREKLEKIVSKKYSMVTKGNKDVVRYIVRETIGTGVIEEILKDESITDIGYNGTELIIETNDQKRIFDADVEVTDNYIIRLVNKFANANDRDFTSKNPIFDGRFENIRINAVHSQNTAPESGTTMALRVVRPRLALTDKNFGSFAPPFMKEFFRHAALAKLNMVISGTTGTGKTELHKYISSFIPFNDRIILIEDTPETFMKEMFPEKDIFSWVTNEDVGVTEMIKAGLRSHPVWMMVTETRGSEAYEMIQTVLSGHSIITSLHATDARAIPARFVNMAKMGYTVDEASLTRDIRTYFDLGIHIKKVNYKGRVVRYLSEVINFHPDGDHTIFKQRFLDGKFLFETFELPEGFIMSMEDEMIDVADIGFPENLKDERPLKDSEVTSYQTIIPVSHVTENKAIDENTPDDNEANNPIEENEVTDDNIPDDNEVNNPIEEFDDTEPTEEHDDEEKESKTKPKFKEFISKLFGGKKGQDAPETIDEDNQTGPTAKNISSNVIEIIKSKDKS